MATYECSKCGMSVNATCGKCNEQLVNDTLKLEDGLGVQISKCPNDHGKIKSPLCCGQDMVCKVELLCSTWQQRERSLPNFKLILF